MEEEYLIGTPDPFNLGEGKVTQSKLEYDKLMGKYIRYATQDVKVNKIVRNAIKLEEERGGRRYTRRSNIKFFKYE